VVGAQILNAQQKLKVVNIAIMEFSIPIHEAYNLCISQQEMNYQG